MAKSNVFDFKLLPSGLKFQVTSTASYCVYEMFCLQSMIPKDNKKKWKERSILGQRIYKAIEKAS